MSLEFRHIDDTRQSPPRYRWPFVYLHGEAEIKGLDLDVQSAPDLCIANQAAPPVEPGQVVTLDCTVYGQPAKCVLYGAHNDPGLPSGRIALLSDAKGLAHALSPKDWR